MKRPIKKSKEFRKETICANCDKKKDAVVMKEICRNCIRNAAITDKRNIKDAEENNYELR